MRYNKLERIGVNAFEKAILDIGWIFREQPIVDVGIDAIIEQSEDGEPKGSTWNNTADAPADLIQRFHQVL